MRLERRCFEEQKGLRGTKECWMGMTGIIAGGQLLQRIFFMSDGELITYFLATRSRHLASIMEPAHPYW
jgi:hypothetical protein